MARKVIICSYCSETFEKWEYALRHETGCEFNPANKACWTCEHHSVNSECELELKTDFDGEFNCPSHVKQKENKLDFDSGYDGEYQND